jgi:hypothetical protein
MDLKKEILKAHSKFQTDKIIGYVGNDPLRFKLLVNTFLEGPYRITQRAAWPLSYCVIQHPALVKPYLKTLLDHLHKDGIHDSVKRNTLRFLQFTDIPKRYHGIIVDLCFGYLHNKKEPVAIQVFAMTVLYNLAQVNPDLKQELKIIIEDQLPYGKPAFISRAKKILKFL